MYNLFLQDVICHLLCYIVSLVCENNQRGFNVCGLMRAFHNSVPPRVCNVLANHSAPKSVTRCALGKGPQISFMANSWRRTVVHCHYHLHVALLMFLSGVIVFRCHLLLLYTLLLEKVL